LKQLGQTVPETLSQKKNPPQNGLVEWLQVQNLSSNPSTANKTKQNKNKNKSTKLGQVVVAHTYYSSYLGG
jgi:hypothetical protein